MQRCKDSCPKIRQKAGSSQASRSQADGFSYTEQTEDPNGSSRSPKRSVTLSSRQSRQSQKSVQIGGVTAVEVTESQSTKSGERSTNYTEKDPPFSTGVTKSRKKRSAQDQDEEKTVFENREITGTRVSASRESPHSTKQNEMSGRVRSSPKGTEGVEWDSTGHNPCPSSCPMSKARERAAKKAQLRQERLDDYLLNKGFSYFNDLCTCSSICLFNQLRRDKFVLDFLKSACLFTLGVKLCEELDAWNLIG